MMKHSVEYAFTDIFDIPKLQELCENFTRINGTVTALLDLEGNVHIQTGWQDICTKFHRANPNTAKRCTESDTALAGQLNAGESYNVYKCKNGLVDVAVPVYVDGEHVANFFTGQFFFEEPSREYFTKQAEKYGFETIPYIDALDHVPIFSEEHVSRTMDFLVNLVQVIGEMGKARLDFLRMQETERQKLEKLVAIRTKELEEAKEQLELLASIDSLTGLYNRRSFDERYQQAFSYAKRYLRSLTLVILDIDLFKSVNDVYGHSVGDDVLRKVADCLKESVREVDIVARYGGEEFCIVFPDTPPMTIQPLVERIRENISHLRFVVDDKQFSVTCSFGIAYLNNAINRPSDLIEKADAALYRAKAAGRNRVVEFHKMAGEITDSDPRRGAL